MWSLVQYETPGLPGHRLGVLDNDTVRALPSHWPHDMLALLDSWHAWQDKLRSLDPVELDAVADARLVLPITHPRKVICAGANFYDHAAEMGTARPDPAESPFFFLKPPTTALTGPYDTIRVRDIEGAGLDWEIELAVVIADRCADLAVDEVDAHVAGYTVSNDLSARLRFPRPNAVLAPFAFDWLKHKAFDQSCPIGPGITPAWQVGDPGDLSLRLSVNGVVKQDSSTRDMVVDVRRLVSEVSHTLTLEPGDLILTGTPAGVGMPRKDFLHNGDVVEAEIEGLGRIINTLESA
ncbi:2-hydroxyhepta-2,4-diene-1,7-dioate isomerase [Rhodococcus sp. NCIMB 12038]|nr:2-hydroxyhepta-2,4-diene-1,7-dioate isomerase [Rhodococcus sp. NCIMB 12038]